MNPVTPLIDAPLAHQARGRTRRPTPSWPLFTRGDKGNGKGDVGDGGPEGHGSPEGYFLE